ncbi:DNA polymerase V, subunit C [Legionella steigerwaltii]|uniref:DNA polymerase V, subunit C n=1 Tax=Legionella steigerwaltii TaxID=460 RepID=A0A378L5X1_9GAMM|nr:Y-family DNA polymerase [Legionella steigerwaltii]KTD78047.1 DNA polymerase V, subunit C [Legionella steigerwaltii]STY22216.1 DNA polymerase V, subunit C [Legionella steigerwaltii]
MYALIDCNNFYASCERLFRPDLREKPIIVLSSNDGCVIARSNEAKALGVGMGEPYFRVKSLCARHQIQVFSSNFTLYGDLSQRVMATIEQDWPHMEIYSIDEAFLDLSSMPVHLHDSFCLALQKKILKNTGIPTSIGIAQTKTLAKLANHLCKKVLKTPIFNMNNQEEWLKKIAIGDVWGIGRKWSKKLIDYGIYTAFDLATTNVHVLKKQFNVVVMRTALELQGISCHDLEIQEAKQSILSSKSFGSMQTEYAAVAEALSSHCARAVEKLRAQRSLTHGMHVFIYTNRFRDDLAQHVQSIEVRFVHPTDDLRIITHLAKKGLFRIFKQGYHYKKTGVCLVNLTSKESRQLDLFHQVSQKELQATEDFMFVFDKINQKFGRNTLYLAAEGCNSKPWDARLQMCSPRYTTCWSELPVVRIRSRK